MTNRQPTGRVSDGEIIINRHITHPVTNVWRYLTESALLGEWYGTYSGDPATGEVLLTTREAPDHPGAARILYCTSPERLEVMLASPAGEWQLSVALQEKEGATALEFRQPVGELSYSAEDLGPGWEYYLDALELALEGGNVDSLAWDDYHPALCPAYRV